MNHPNVHVIAADIARRVPVMAGEIAENNEALILSLLQPFVERIGELEKENEILTKTIVYQQI